MTLALNIKKYYLYSFFAFFSFWLPIFMLYLLKNGLSYTEIMIMAVIGALTQIFLEVPSGVFADFFGRKTTLTMSTIAKAIALLFMFFGNSFVPFLISWIIFGMGRAFESGTNSAFLYDTLRDLKRESEYKKIEGLGFSYGQAGMAVGALIGGFLAVISFKIPIFLTLIAMLIATGITLSFKEPKHHKRSDDRDYFAHLKEAAIFSFNHKKVKLLILFSGIMMALMIISHKFMQPYMEISGVDLKYFGIIYFVWLAIGSLSARYAHVIEKRLGEFWSLMLIPILLAINFLIIGKYVFFYGFVVIGISQVAWGFTTPVIKDYLNKHIKSHHRATVLSLNGFMESIMLALMSPVFGYLADAISLTSALFIEGIIVLVIGIPLVFMIKKRSDK